MEKQRWFLQARQHFLLTSQLRCLTVAAQKRVPDVLRKRANTQLFLTLCLAKIELIAWGWDGDRSAVGTRDGFGQGALLKRLSVHQEDGFEALDDGADPFEEFALVGVAGEFVDADDFGAEAHQFAEYRDFRHLVDDLTAERVFGLEAGDEDGVTAILNAVAEVMEDAARFAHTGGGDDEVGVAKIVERL